MEIDAEMVHKNSVGLELLRPLYLIPNTTFEMGERTPKLLFQHGGDIAIQFANGDALTHILVYLES